MFVFVFLVSWPGLFYHFVIVFLIIFVVLAPMVVVGFLLSPLRSCLLFAVACCAVALLPCPFACSLGGSVELSRPPAAAASALLAVAVACLLLLLLACHCCCFACLLACAVACLLLLLLACLSLSSSLCPLPLPLDSSRCSSISYNCYHVML